MKSTGHLKKLGLPLSIIFSLFLGSLSLYGDEGQKEESRFSFDSVTNYLRSINFGLNRSNDPDSMIYTGLPSQIVINSDLSQIISRTNRMSGTQAHYTRIDNQLAIVDRPDCLFQEDGSQAELDQLQLCSREGLYREDHIDQVTRESNRLPENYVLLLDTEKLSRHCQCVRSKSGLYNINGAMNEVDSMKRRSKTIDNLLNYGMQKLANQFARLSPRVMFALTSAEMASLHMKESIAESAEGRTRSLEQQSVLNSCAPGQFTAFLSNQIKLENAQNSLCTKEGIERLGRGFISEHRRRCQNQEGNDGEGCDATDLAGQSIRAIDRYIRRTGVDDNAMRFVNRHYEQYQQRRPGEKTDLVPITTAEEFRSLRGRVGNRENIYTEYIESALVNELMPDGRALWLENNGPILRALKIRGLYDGEVPEDTPENWRHFEAQLSYNPFLGSHIKKIRSNRKANEPELTMSQIVDQFVDGELGAAIKLRMASGDRDQSSKMDINDVTAALLISYGQDYSDTIKECEDIQKTLLSLCQAATNHAPMVEQVSDFYTNPNLVKLFLDANADVYEGKNPAIAGDLISAAGMFCEENITADRVLTRNEESIRNQHHFNREFRVMSQIADQVGLLRSSKDVGAIFDNIRRINFGDGEHKSVDLNNINDGTHTVLTNSGGLGDQTADIVGTPFTGNTIVQRTNDKKATTRIDGLATVELNSAAATGEFSEIVGTNVVVAPETAKPILNKPDSLFNIENRPAEIPSSSFFDTFVNPVVSHPTEQNTIGVPEVSAQDAQGAEIDPIQAQLMAQLERMRERENEMAQELRKMRDSVEDEKEQRMVDRFEKEQRSLKDKIESLTSQLNEKKAEQQRAATNTASSQSFSNSLMNSGLRGSASPSNSRASTTQASSSGPAANQVPTSAALPSRPNNRAAASSNVAQQRNTAAGLGLIATSSQSSAARAQQRSLPTSIAAGDMNLANLARSVDGNTALRQTADPNIIEKIVFKEIDGKIVFIDGQPVIERTELVSVDEAQALAQVDEVEPSRAPASIEEQMQEIEQSLYPRSRVYSAEELADEIRRGRRMQE